MKVTAHFLMKFTDIHPFVIFQESTYKTTDREVFFTLKKARKLWWSRLTATPQKPAWLKVPIYMFKLMSKEEILLT